MLELNRAQMYMAGLIVLFLGIEFRLVDSIVLNQQATKFVVERFETTEIAPTAPNWLTLKMPVSNKAVTPPKWLGWSFLSLGGVMVLHALAMRK